MLSIEEQRNKAIAEQIRKMAGVEPEETPMPRPTPSKDRQEKPQEKLPEKAKEKQHETVSSIVEFDRLLSTNFQNEEYKILAISNLDEWLESEQKSNKPSTKPTSAITTNMSLTKSQTAALEKAITDLSTYTGTYNTNFVDSNKFIAEVKPFKLALPPENSGQDAYYRTVEADYDIVSCKPPTSVLQGRLYYAWPSEKGVKRPLANTSFRVIVNYIDSKIKKPLGDLSTITGSFVPEQDHCKAEAKYSSNGQGFSVTDQFATMGVGTTDADGNFVIEVVNMNKKGSLGPVDITYSSNKKPEVPKIDTDIQTPYNETYNPANYWQSVVNPNPMENNAAGNITNNMQGAQGAINSGFSLQFDAGTGSFELGQGATKSVKGGVGSQSAVHAPVEDYIHGPNPSNEMAPPPVDYNPYQREEQFDIVNTVHYDNLLRVYRIVIDRESAGYYYPSAETVEIQPFESNATPYNITNFVREAQVTVFTKTRNAKNEILPLSEVQVTIFRDINNKPKGLPQGEGDGKYDYKPLINPEYTTQAGAQSQTEKINANDIFSQKFEHLWSGVTVSDLKGNTDADEAKGNRYGVVLKKLIGCMIPYYFVESSSSLNKSSTISYGAVIKDIGINALEFNSSEYYANPLIPSKTIELELTPLLSRALMKVRDVISGKQLTSDNNARVCINEDKNFATVDKYGYAEFVANQYPLSHFLKNADVNAVDLQFYGTAKGYKKSDIFKASLHKTGENAEKDFALSPGGVIKGRIMTQEAKGSKPNTYYYGSVSAYLQVDSGKVFETQANGNFEINVPLIENSQLKVIPKDVAFFEDSVKITSTDSKNELKNLNDFAVSRRLHRLRFIIREKGLPYGPNTFISNCSVQLGDEKYLNKPGDVGIGFQFENVSVNNYSVVINGPAGSGYIPKILNISNAESKVEKEYPIELEKGSEVSGTVKLDGVPVSNARVYVDVDNSSSDLSVNVNPSLGAGTGAYSTSPNSTTLPGQSAQQGLPTVENITDASAGLLVTYTDKSGKFILLGIPADNAEIKLHATLDTTFTVAGATQIASIKNKKSVVDMEMTSFKAATITNIYGFPLSIESITPVNNKQVKVTGLVHWTEGITDFNLKEVAKQVRIEETLFDLVTTNGNTVGVANPAETTLSGINSLKLSLLGKYNVQLYNPDGNFLFNSSPLKLVRKDDIGKISGKMKIVDNSFNYPSTYLDFDGSEFYLSTINSDKSINNIVDVVSSAMGIKFALKPEYNSTKVFIGAVQTAVNQYNTNPAAYYATYYPNANANMLASQKKGVFNLCDKDANPIKFKLIRFNATANPQNSYMDKQGKIHLNVDLSCHIPNAQPENFSVNIPEIILDDNKVNPASSSTPIQVKLEDWTLEAKNWSFSVEEGGILSKNAKIRTKLIDIPVKKFVLRSDMFLMNEFELSNLSLGGGKFKLLVDTTKSKPSLNYEYKAGSDMQPHWNFCMISNGTDKVASLESLNGLKDQNGKNYTMDFDYLQILSNDEMIVQLKQNDNKLNLLENPLARFTPLSIFNGPNYIEVKGTVNAGAPRVPNIPITLNYTSPKAVPTYGNVSLDFETKGFVHFTAVEQKLNITKTLISIENGWINEQPGKTFNPIPGSFYARANASPTYEVMMRKGWVTQLSSEEKQDPKNPAQSSSGEGYSLKIDKGGMQVEGDDWSTCKFSGTMHNNNTKSTDNIKDSPMAFEVLGDIAANSDGVTATGIDTPFGSMTQTFDFKTKTLIGSVTINNFEAGGFRIHKGVIETLFSPGGFYVAGATYAYIPAGAFSGDYNMGFMAGSYQLTDRLWEVVNTCIDPIVRNNCYKRKTQKLSGVYTAFNRELFRWNVSKDYVIASGYVDALGLVGGDLFFNVSSAGWKMGFGGYVHIGVAAGLSAITGTSISGGFTADGKVGAEVGSQGVDFNTLLALSFWAHLKQSLVLTTIEKDISVDCSATVGTSGFNISLNGGGKNVGCE